MSEKEIGRLLDRLSESAEVLHGEAQSIDMILEGIEERVRGLGLALEVWLERPLRSRDLSVSASSVAPRVDTQLGFAPAGRGREEKWQLQVREAEFTPHTDAEGEDAWELTRILSQKTADRCTREERTEILEWIPALLEQLDAATRRRIDTIRGSRRLIE